jgi:hypothetical protein
MPQPFVLRERWFDVSLPEFEAFLRDYPRLLEARPPLHQKANYREWVDPALGKWPGNAVGKSWKRVGCLGYPDPARLSAQGVGAGAEKLPVV